MRTGEAVREEAVDIVGVSGSDVASRDVVGLELSACSGAVFEAAGRPSDLSLISSAR